MSNNKQSSIEWLIVEIMQHQKTFYGVASMPFWLVEQAKEKHKQEMVDFGNDLLAQNDSTYIAMPDKAKQYYNETYGDDKQ